MPEEPSEDRCAYCGGTELDGLSPFVVGQTREEFNALQQNSLPQVLDGPVAGMRAGATVKFLLLGQEVPPPRLDVPYFPLLSAQHGEDLLDHCMECGLGEAGVCIAHELCALEMFKARMHRTHHTLRRRRTLVAEKAIAMSGIHLRPLGVDARGWEYWKFPSSPYLFVCMSSGLDADKAAFKAMQVATPGQQPSLSAPFGPPSASGAQAAGSRRHDWKVVTETSAIVALANTLPAALRASLLECFEEPPRPAVSNEAKPDRTASGAGPEAGSAPLPSASLSTGSGAGAVDDSISHDAMDEDEDEDRAAIGGDGLDTSASKKGPGRPPGSVDNVPVSISLETKKGQDIQRGVSISTEAVFDESPVVDVAGEDAGQYFEYLTFTKKCVNTPPPRCSRR